MKFTTNRSPAPAPSGRRGTPRASELTAHLHRRIAELKQQEAGGTLSDGDRAVLRRFLQVAPPTPEAELRAALGLAPDEEN